MSHVQYYHMTMENSEFVMNDDDYPKLERENDTYDIINCSDGMEELVEMYMLNK